MSFVDCMNPASHQTKLLLDALGQQVCVACYACMVWVLCLLCLLDAHVICPLSAYDFPHQLENLNYVLIHPHGSCSVVISICKIGIWSKASVQVCQLHP